VAELLSWQPQAAAAAAAAGDIVTDITAIPSTADDSSTRQQYNPAADPCSCTTPLQLPIQQQQQGQPQLLVCHDMMGGYLPEEVSLSGVAGCGQYRLWHWDCIDVFVYFSHHMVSIPPTGWIHAAHKHGVKVRGRGGGRLGQQQVLGMCIPATASCNGAFNYVPSLIHCLVQGTHIAKSSILTAALTAC
jgi:hypothetical protein